MPYSKKPSSHWRTAPSLRHFWLRPRVSQRRLCRTLSPVRSPQQCSVPPNVLPPSGCCALEMPCHRAAARARWVHMHPRKEPMRAAKSHGPDGRQASSNWCGPIREARGARSHSLEATSRRSAPDTREARRRRRSHDTGVSQQKSKPAWCGGDRAGMRAGRSVESPRWVRISATTGGSSMVAKKRRRPPQPAYARTLIANTRSMSRFMSLAADPRGGRQRYSRRSPAGAGRVPMRTRRERCRHDSEQSGWPTSAGCEVSHKHVREVVGCAQSLE